MGFDASVCRRTHVVSIDAAGGDTLSSVVGAGLYVARVAVGGVGREGGGGRGRLFFHLSKTLVCDIDNASNTTIEVGGCSGDVIETEVVCAQIERGIVGIRECIWS